MRRPYLATPSTADLTYGTLPLSSYLAPVAQHHVRAQLGVELADHGALDAHREPLRMRRAGNWSP
jgi:hypothetical protein